MSSYIIAGSADSIDTAYCEEIARRISSKYKNIDFRIVIKHPSEWELYLQEICRIYGFLKKSNPIVYTFDGKIIGGRESFVQTASKYFGLDEEMLIVQDISSKINMKQAEEQLRVKKIVKSGAKTLEEKIDLKYKELLTKKILKNSLKQKEFFLVNGIQYIHRELQAVPTMKFKQNAEVALTKEEIVPEEINLMALSLNDQVKPEEPLALGKEAFVTSNIQKEKHPPSEQDRMSEVSKTNKMHQSIVSYDKDSKGVKESNRTKLKIDEQFDDVPDYVDYPFAETTVCELPDQFCVAFEPKSLIGEQLIFYYNEDPAGNVLRLHNDGRPIKGHRVLIKEVHYDNQNIFQGEAYTKNDISENGEMEVAEDQDIGDMEEKIPKIDKPKTEPNIPAIESEKHLDIKTNKQVQEDAISEPHSDLNLVSHLNYHTLFIHKPLSILQLKSLLYFVQETNTIGVLQFLPENPNPRVKLYVRKYLLSDELNLLLPTEKFIDKQIQQGEYTQITVPSEKGVLLSQEIDSWKVRIVNQLGFNHFIIDLIQKNEEKIHKAIKYTIDHMLSIQEQVRHDIGYNLIITKKRIILVPLVEPYATYNNTKLYLDGLAFLGFVHTAKLDRPYEISQPKVGNEQKGLQIRLNLAKSSGYSEQQ